MTWVRGHEHAGQFKKESAIGPDSVFPYARMVGYMYGVLNKYLVGAIGLL